MVICSLNTVIQLDLLCDYDQFCCISHSSLAAGLAVPQRSTKDIDVRTAQLVTELRGNNIYKYM